MSVIVGFRLNGLVVTLMGPFLSCDPPFMALQYGKDVPFLVNSGTAALRDITRCLIWKMCAGVAMKAEYTRSRMGTRSPARPSVLVFTRSVFKAFPFQKLKLQLFAIHNAHIVLCFGN